MRVHRLLRLLTSRQFLADTLAMVIFSTVVGMFIEVVISGMTLQQSVLTRLIATPVNALTGRPYGRFRDWVFKIARTDPKTTSWWWKGILDTVAFVMFQVPLYAGILYTSGATVDKILIATGTVTLLVVPLGAPYGRCLELTRKLFHVEDVAKSS